jgi:hypothetical protein
MKLTGLITNYNSRGRQRNNLQRQITAAQFIQMTVKFDTTSQVSTRHLSLAAFKLAKNGSDGGRPSKVTCARIVKTERG